MSLNAPKSLSSHGVQSARAITDSPALMDRLTGYQLAPSLRRSAFVLVLIGAITIVASVLLELLSPSDSASFYAQTMWASILMVSFLMVSLALAGTLMIALQYLTVAGWSVALRRISEALCGLLIPGLIGIAAVLILRPSLYPWTSIAEGEHAFTGFKGFWLNHTNWLIRAAIYAVIWIVFSWALRMNSRRQDVDGKLSHTRWNVVLSAMFVILFALSYWLASVDWLMSLEPLWFSTMYGVYNFAGLFTGGIALTIVVAVWLRNRGVLRGVISEEHLHDLGKMLLAFTTFWAYIWFCQYMLIWYANIPEETEHFVVRTRNLWLPLFYLNVALNWVIPFLALLPRAGKRDGSFLVKIAVIVLIGRILDMYLLIMPTVSPETPFGSITPLLIILGTIGVVILVVGNSLGKAALVPIKDPYLDESLNYHV